MLEEGTVLICDGCRRLQRVHGEVRSCTKCGGMTFHPIPELQRVASGVSHSRTLTPLVWTERDKEFLRVTRIRSE